VCCRTNDSRRIITPPTSSAWPTTTCAQQMNFRATACSR
jgi:hypothetical protein